MLVTDPSKDTFMYSKDYPTGKLFTAKESKELDSSWVDNPALILKDEDITLNDEADSSENILKKRGRPKKEVSDNS